MTAWTDVRVDPKDRSAPTTVDVDRLLRDLHTSPAGLSPAEAERRLAIHGPNELPRHTEHHWLRDVVHQLTHPLALLLWVAAALAALTGTPTLTWAILLVIAINAAVALLQENQAVRAVAALQGYLPPHARVIRDGTHLTVDAVTVVPGDLIVVSEGDRICADARLIDGAVELDLSTLTGESVPVTRNATDIGLAPRLVDAQDAVFSGATCTRGQARAIVFATGATTELGRIAVLTQHDTAGESPLERQVRHAAWLISGVAVAIGLLFLPLGLLAGMSLPDAAVFAVGLLVANVPEGLLPTITLALAVGVRVLARSGALVKRLSAVETLGSTTVICTDKTGTLTQNRMRVVEVWTVQGPAEPDGASRELLETMLDSTEDGSADPTDAALRSTAIDGHVPVVANRTVFAFDATRKRMSTVGRRNDAEAVAVKGAPESVLPLCTHVLDRSSERPMDADDRAAALQAVDRLADRGLRVLALARRDVVEMPTNAAAAEQDLCLVGLVALLDPPRPEVADAVRSCHNAGIRVHVVTGDHGRTATEIARRVGIEAHCVLNGPDVDAMTDAQLGVVLDEPGEIVFARSTPEGKLRIAEALHRRGDTVAMTGDGVNDAPALHHADIGIAMGRSGTDVAREAATMVLTDDNFATIVIAVREGRRAYENLRKFVLYIFAHAVPEVVPFAVFALSAGAVPLPLTVLQILAIDLGTETLPALALGRERAEPDLMRRPPRPHREPLITRRLLVRAWLVMGSVSALLALGMFFLTLHLGGWHLGADTGTGSSLHHVWQQATTATFLTIVACQIGTALAARTDRASLRTVGLFGNRLLLAGIAFEIAFAAAAVYLPGVGDLFGTAAPPAVVLVLLAPCPVLVWGVDEVYRAVSRRRAVGPAEVGPKVPNRRVTGP